MGNAFAGPKQRHPKRVNNKDTPEKSVFAGHELLPPVEGRGGERRRTKEPVRFSSPSPLPSPLRLSSLVTCLPFVRIEYPRMQTQSSFFAGMWHWRQSVLWLVATFRVGSFASNSPQPQPSPHRSLFGKTPLRVPDHHEPAFDGRGPRGLSGTEFRRAHIGDLLYQDASESWDLSGSGRGQ